MPYYEDIETIAEIDIRGRYLMMAADLEFCLLNILAYSTPDPLNQIRRFKKMMFNDKVLCTIKDLKKYKRNYYNQYKDDLDKLDEFRIIRNEMAHNKIDFPFKGDLSRFHVVFVDEENGVEGIKLKEYTLPYLKDSIDRFRKLNVVFAQLWLSLKDDYNSGMNTPLVHPNATGQ